MPVHPSIEYMQNRLIKEFDKTYDETFTKLLHTTHSREEAKKLMGEIYSKTSIILKKTKHTSQEVPVVLEKVKYRFGIV
jgi:hypothetical protein